MRAVALFFCSPHLIAGGCLSLPLSTLSPVSYLVVAWSAPPLSNHSFRFTDPLRILCCVCDLFMVKNHPHHLIQGPHHQILYCCRAGQPLASSDLSPRLAATPSACRRLKLRRSPPGVCPAPTFVCLFGSKQLPSGVWVCWFRACFSLFSLCFFSPAVLFSLAFLYLFCYTIVS